MISMLKLSFVKCFAKVVSKRITGDTPFVAHEIVDVLNLQEVNERFSAAEISSRSRTCASRN
jgi:spore coat polysaccharide biosynthesis protein SpsF (cytidylyltransferase family)